MKKPAFVFDGRNILDAQKLSNIGFKIYQIGTSDKVLSSLKGMEEASKDYVNK